VQLGVFCYLFLRRATLVAFELPPTLVEMVTDLTPNRGRRAGRTRARAKAERAVVTAPKPKERGAKDDARSPSGLLEGAFNSATCT
jgi:hypothetical protein